MALVPNAFIIIMLGVIPMGDPSKGVFKQDGVWPFVFVVNPICMTVMAFLVLAVFYSCAGIAKPFRTFFPSLIVVYIAEVVVMVAVVTPVGNIQFIRAGFIRSCLSRFMGSHTYILCFSS